MNELIIFKNENFGEVRTVNINGEIWFVLADICKILGIKNVTQMAQRLDEDEKSMFDIGLSGGTTNIVNEYGLYSVILRSDKPNAKLFKRWITHEILPEIRETGGYNLPKSLPEALKLYANEIEKRQQIEEKLNKTENERDFYKDTKSWIGSNREATAMAKASVLSRKVNTLEKKLDMCKGFASTMKVASLLGVQNIHWYPLKKYCEKHRLKIGKWQTPYFKNPLNTYPSEAWFNVYNINLFEIEKGEKNND